MPIMNTPNQSGFPENPSFDFVVSRIKSLLDQIQEAIEEGTLHVLEYKRWRGEPTIDYALAPNLVRHIAKKYLIDCGQAAKGEEETDATEFEAEDIPNNGLCISTAEFVIRILKSSEDGSVPRPGISQARINYYRHNQGILDFDGNGSQRPQPTYNLIVHWMVDRDYILSKMSVALPYDVVRNESGRWDVFCLFDEPYWTKAPQSKIAPITGGGTGGVITELKDTDIPVEDESEEKTGEEPEDK